MATEKNCSATAYHNWKDKANGPLVPRAEDCRGIGKKQGDPTEKPGLVGLFCRAYDIYAAIDKFLPTCSKSEGHDRYTFINGTTSNGLVVYEKGKFIFQPLHRPAGASMQRLRPYCGCICTASATTKERIYAKPSDMPSFGLMEELCQRDEAVSRLRASEKVSGSGQRLP